MTILHQCCCYRIFY